MKCFVIMPFEERFHDVYTQIKHTVEVSLSEHKARCFRLDEMRPSGRITERLLRELNEASLCIADVTGNKPNVMWEVGYAMALHKPTILLTQDVDSLPFDIRDMQTIGYDRDHLTQSLGAELKRVVLDTLKHYESADQPSQAGQTHQVARLLQEVESLKGMVASAIELLPKAKDQRASSTPHDVPPLLEGHWVIQDSRSHLYARVIDGQLIAPYCYGGNDRLTAVFFDWRRANEYWFARFAWFDDDLAGFAFVKQIEPKRFSGAWWGDETAGADIARAHECPPERSGEPLLVTRAAKQDVPDWAEHFFAEVQRYGLVKMFAMKSQRAGWRGLFSGT